MPATGLGLNVDLGALANLSPRERAQVEADLLELEERLKANPLFGYRPHHKQIEFHQAEPTGGFPPLRAFFGGNRSGKTTAAILDTIVQAVDEDIVPDHLKAYKRWAPPFKCRVITPDFGDSHEVVLEKLREWCPRGQLRGGSFPAAFDKVKRVLWFKNESRIHFNSNVQDREQLGGSDLHRVVYDEEPRQDLRSESLTRLIDHDGEEIFAMTPFSGMSWLYDDIYEPWEAGRLKASDGRVVVVDMDDNPHLSPDGKRRALAQYSATEREARKSGRFVHFAGLIYPEFKWDTHGVPAPRIPSDRRVPALPPGVEVFAGIDPGLRHPAVVFCYLDTQDRLVVFDEILMEATIERVCEEIRKHEAVWRIQPRWYVIDPAVRNRNPQTGKSDQDEFIAQGITALPGQNDVRLGINNVKQRLEASPPKLLVTSNCQELRNEFKRYRWASPRRHVEDDRLEKPVKHDDHLLDALRYVVMRRPLRPLEEVIPESETMKDRILRHHLKRLGRRGPLPDSGFGPGQWA